MTEHQALPSPSLLRRLAAMLYDALLVLPLIMAGVAAFMGVRTLLGYGAAADGTVQLGPYTVRGIALLCTVLFFCAFWARDGQTLGMQAWRIKLVDFDGGQPHLGRLLLRCAGAFVSAACLGLGYLWCLVDRRGRYWHDHLSRTELVLLPKRRKPDRS